VLVRSWNLFHGNTLPPRRLSYLEEMVRLATADRPDVLLLQEMPAWSLERLGDWSGMTAVADIAARPVLGPFPIPAELGHMLTSFHNGFFRSAFAGQGNAILLAEGLEVVSREVVVLNPASFRREQSRRLGLDLVARLAWEKERRICQVVRLGRGMVVANLHATSAPGDRRIPETELHRAADAVLARAQPGDTIVLGGDFNVPGEHAALEGFSPPGPWIDHILVRGARSSPVRVWPDERRLRGGMLLSDHTPVEVEL
jgi:endonuclease/exonuclease/phosphatase family metal-dependent hydrolase